MPPRLRPYQPRPRAAGASGITIESNAARAARERGVAVANVGQGVGPLDVESNAARALRERGLAVVGDAASPLFQAVCGRPGAAHLPGTVGGLLPSLPGAASATPATPAQAGLVYDVGRSLGLAGRPPNENGVTPIRQLGRDVPLGAGPTLDDAGTLCVAACADPMVPPATWAPRLLDVRYEGVTGSMKAWADLAVADAWFAYAAALASDPAWEATLDALPETMRGHAQDAVVRPMCLWQRDYMESILGALANGFNALNIPWSAHPGSRQLYRKWLAGIDEPSIYQKTEDYNAGNWYNKAGNSLSPARREEDWKYLYPMLARGTSNPGAGIIPTRLREDFNRYGLPDGETWTIEFAQNAGLRLIPLRGGEFDQSGKARDVWYETATVNSAFVTSRTFQWIRAASTGRDDLDGPVMADDEWRARGQDKWPDSQRLRDWRTMSFAWAFSINNADPRRVVLVSAPLRWYLPYLREWTVLMAAEGAAKALADARAFVIQANARWIRDGGGVATFLDDATGARARALAESTANPNMPLSVVSSLALAAGVALGPATGGIATLIGGAIGGITGLLAASLRSGDVTSTARDDLGRWKPVLERSFLGGSVNDESPRGMPQQYVPVPPGFCRALAGGEDLPDYVAPPPVDLGAAQGGGGGDDDDDDDDDDESESTFPSVPLIAGAIAGTLAAVGLGVVVARARASNVGPPSARQGANR